MKQNICWAFLNSRLPLAIVVTHVLMKHITEKIHNIKVFWVHILFTWYHQGLNLKLTILPQKTYYEVLVEPLNAYKYIIVSYYLVKQLYTILREIHFFFDIKHPLKLLNIHVVVNFALHFLNEPFVFHCCSQITFCLYKKYYMGWTGFVLLHWQCIVIVTSTRRQ